MGSNLFGDVGCVLSLHVGSGRVVGNHVDGVSSLFRHNRVSETHLGSRFPYHRCEVADHFLRISGLEGGVIVVLHLSVPAVTCFARHISQAWLSPAPIQVFSVGSVLGRRRVSKVVGVGNGVGVVLGSSVEFVAEFEGWASVERSVGVVLLQLDSSQGGHVDDRSCCEVRLEGDLKGKRRNNGNK